MSVDWHGEGAIMALDVPINVLLKGWAVGRYSDAARSAAVLLGAAQYWLYGNVIKGSNLALNSNAWDALSALGTTFIATYMYGETMTRRQWIGTALIIGGLVLL